MKKFSLKDRYTLPDYDDPNQMQTGVLDFDPEKCQECGLCVLLCPGGGILTDRVTKMELMHGERSGGKCGVPYMKIVRPGVTCCIACFDCGTVCPNSAISIKHNFNPGYFFKRLAQTSEMRYPKKY